MKLDDLPQPERVETVHPDELETDGDNPNEQSDEMFGLLCENMRQKGWIGNHIVADENGLIADGEHRWRAAQEIGLEEVPVKFYSIDDSERRLWRQELNKISGEHDKKRDALEYKELLDNGKSDEVNELVDATGEDLDELLAEIKVDNSLPPQYEYDAEHNVYFEDCVEGMQNRLEDDSVDCVITDPPYGMDLSFGDLSAIEGRDMRNSVEGDGEEEALELFETVMRQVKRVLTNDGHLYCFATWRTAHEFRTIIENHGFTVCNYLVWEKADASQFATFGPDSLPRYAYKHEFILFAVRERGKPLEGSPDEMFEHLEARWSDVVDQKTDHPTQKPTELVNDFITNSTDKGDTILDPFMGSGTTAVAAIQNDRDYVGFELDKDNYKPVIERRIGEAKRQVEANN